MDEVTLYPLNSDPLMFPRWCLETRRTRRAEHSSLSPKLQISNSKPKTHSAFPNANP